MLTSAWASVTTRCHLTVTWCRRVGGSRWTTMVPRQVVTSPIKPSFVVSVAKPFFTWLVPSSMLCIFLKDWVKKMSPVTTVSPTGTMTTQCRAWWTLTTLNGWTYRTCSASCWSLSLPLAFSHYSWWSRWEFALAFSIITIKIGWRPRAGRKH